MGSRDWYLAPLLEILVQVDWSDLDNPVLVNDGYLGPASGDPLAPTAVAGMRCFAYSMDEGTVLVSIAVGDAAPAEWTSKTYAQALSHFESVMGRPPVSGEMV